MPTLVYGEGVPTLGATRVMAVLTMASMAAPDLSTDILHATSVEISTHLYPAGWTPGGTTARGTQPARLSTKVQVESFNRSTFTIGDLQYVYLPQAADAAAGNEAKELLVSGVKVYLVERIGLDAEAVDWAIGQRTVTHYVQVGAQIKSGDRTDENGEFFITQAVRYVNATGPVDGVIVA